jgi:diguanylate cyclase (GGDEF)-like protein/PAS domain S-box-containing protein
VNSTLSLTDQNSALQDYAHSKNESDKRRLETIWLALASNQSFLKQIRFVDTKGQEQIKVSYSFDRQEAIAEHDYSTVREAYYLQFAEGISHGEVKDIGPVLERMSFDDEDETLSPVQYVISPVELDGERVGYIILTIDIWLVKSLLDFSPQPDYVPRLVTPSGDYIAHPDPEKLFGFSIKNRKIHNLALTHNDLWQNMLVNGSGVTHQDDGLYVYRLIDLSESKSMYALIYFSDEQLAQQVARDYTDILENAVLIIFLIFVACIPFAHLAYIIQRKTVESSLALAALNGMTAVIVCDNKYRVLKVNRELEKMTEYSDKKIRLSNVRRLFFKQKENYRWLKIWNLVNKNGYWEGEMVIRGSQRNEINTLTRVQALLDKNGTVTNYIISLVDISEQKQLEERLRYLSERDELSQLWNRRKFEQDLRSAADLFERYPENHGGCLALLDIDFFKRINDEQGHDEGDRVIQRVAKHLVESTRKTDTVARIGGEEFAIIMRNTSTEEATLILDRIRSAIETDSTHSATISIGFTDITSDSSIFYKYADIALYESKSLGRNQVSFVRSSDEIA